MFYWSLAGKVEVLEGGEQLVLAVAGGVLATGAYCLLFLMKV
jgi:hypothetical protein